MATQRANHPSVSVLFSQQYYGTAEARYIRSQLRRQRQVGIGGSVNAAEQRLVYHFVSVDLDSTSVEEAVRRQIGAGDRLLLSFEERIAEQLVRIAPHFPSEQFYVVTECSARWQQLPDNVHLFLLQTAGYDYLLGYFVSLLFHYRLLAARVPPRAVVISDDTACNAARVSAAVYGLRSVAADLIYERLPFGATHSWMQVSNLFARLTLDNTTAVLLLTDTLPHAFVRAARRHRIALITRSPRRWPSRMPAAQRRLQWDAIITRHLLPAIWSGRDSIIAPAHGYYTVQYRSPLNPDSRVVALTHHFAAIAMKIRSGRVRVDTP